MNKIAGNKKGFSIVEALVSLVILTFVLMGLMQAIIIASEANVKNALRETAGKVAREQLEKVRTQARDTTTGGGYDQIAALTTTKTITFKNTTVPYTLEQTVTLSRNSKIVGLRITWKYRPPTTYNFPGPNTYTYIVVTK